MFQNKYYWPIGIGLSFVLALIIGSLYGRPFGGLLWGGFLRVTLVHHFTFFINSLCHFSGKRPFKPNITARDSWWLAYLTFGEGFHNFHHKFQWDYRNGIRWYDFDPGKWVIKFLSFFKLTAKIRKVDDHKILRARFNGLKSNFQLYFSKIPKQMKNTYQERFKKIQNQANKTYDIWRKFEMNFKEIFTVTMILFAVIDIVGNIPVIISLRRKVGKIESEKATIVASCIMIAFLFIGEEILNLIGIDINSFAVAGSIVIFFLALEMILGISLFQDDQPETASIVPIAFPLIAGAGTLTTLLSLRAEFQLINIIVAIIINSLFVYIVLKSSNRIENVLGKNGIAVVRKVFGIILLSIAVKLFSTNIALIT